jgi:NifU-like protein involved in Fe-S cluster formation
LLYLIVREGRIEKVHYETNGCPSAMACASMLCQLAAGRDVEKARTISANDLVLCLGGLPEGKGDCAARAANALKDALK